MGWNSEIQICAPVNYLFHMQEHCKLCMQFSYFWTPVVVIRKEPVLKDSSDLQHEVCNTTQVQTLNSASMLYEITTGRCGIIDLDHLSCLLHIM